MLCKCPRDELCEPCRTSLYANLRGVAARRGAAWADYVRRHVHGSRAWPPHEGRAAELARTKVADLARDPQLLELLAVELARWAAKRWGQS